MKAISIKPTKGVHIGSRLNCIDNTGAKELEVISVKGYKGVKRKIPGAGIGSVVICAVKKGNQKIVHEIVKAVLVRQRLPYRRPSGMRIKFEDNAAVLVDDKLEPRGKEIRGVIAKEVVERFSTIGKIASSII